MRLVRTTVLFGVWLIVFAVLGCGGQSTSHETADDDQADDDAVGDQTLPEIDLHSGWAIQSSARVMADGKDLSSTAYQPANWYPTTVPATVLAALVQNGVYPDPYFGANLNAIPGSRVMGIDTSDFPMPDGSPFAKSWWYRTTFKLPGDYAGRTVWLRFGGINFRANIWLNGRQIADAGEVAGTFRTWEFNVTAQAHPGAANALAVEIFAPTIHDLAYNWVDWNPAPPDRDMGLIREVTVAAGGPVALRRAHVVTHLDLPSMKQAHVTVFADLVNTTDETQQGILRGQLGDIAFEKSFSLSPRETRQVNFSPGVFDQLNIDQPRVWWPAKLGAQNLYQLDLQFVQSGAITERAHVQFGIREITSRMTMENWRVFQINGKDILIRGGAWTPEMLLRPSDEREEADIRYALDIGLNTIRSEGKPLSDHFLDLCDRLGMLVMYGWCCCDHWEQWGSWDGEDFVVAGGSQRSQVERMRNHPSALMWLNGSDNAPPPDVERGYIDILERAHWPNPILPCADDESTTLSGFSGVKMTGPYDYVPPIYWYVDEHRGGAFGFNTETGPGEAVPPLASLTRFLPPEDYWPIDAMWRYHAARGWYLKLGKFTTAIARRYGEATGIADYAMKSQVIAYDNHRAMFEAYSRNKYHATGVVQWMLNNAWPSLIWHLYDFYLVPGGAFFGAKKSCELVHVQYSYDDQSIVVVNGYYRDFPGMKVSARVLNFDLTEKFAKEATVDIGADSSTRVFDLPAIDDLTTTYFVKLTLSDASGELVSDNFYWLSTKAVVMIGAFTEQGPITWEDADMTMLAQLPPVTLNVSEVSVTPADNPGEQTLQATIENSTDALAFAVELRLTQGPGGGDVTPIYWSDNYFSLLPGEQKIITATFNPLDLGDQQPTLVIGGWNSL